MDFEELQRFAQINSYLPKTELALKLSKMPMTQRAFVINQLNGLSKGKEKLPLWLEKKLIFPPTVNLEQCSSQIAAELKLELFSGERMADLTGGFGVDATMAAMAGFEVTHVEPDETLQKVVQFNAEKLNLNKLQFFHGKAEDFLDEMLQKQKRFDTLFIDPSRRDTQQRKMVSLTDCVPNLLEILPKMAHCSECMVLKLSPMLDIHKAVEDLNRVLLPDKELVRIRVVSIKNECKELLFQIGNKSDSEPIMLELLNVEHTEVQRFQTVWPLVQIQCSALAEFEFIYDAHASIHKAQAYSAICDVFPVALIANNTKLFVSNQEIKDFPGKGFSLIEILPYKKLKSSIQANISMRNFPDSEPEIRKKTGIQFGDKERIFAVRNQEKKLILLHCEAL